MYVDYSVFYIVIEWLYAKYLRLSLSYSSIEKGKMWILKLEILFILDLLEKIIQKQA